MRLELAAMFCKYKSGGIEARRDSEVRWEEREERELGRTSPRGREGSALLNGNEDAGQAYRDEGR